MKQDINYHKQLGLVHGLVSVVVPCYNVADYIEQFFDSLISQTYRNLEIILINDGSTDETRHIIGLYHDKLCDCGYSVLILDQQNQGVANAINAGLKEFNGEFLMWPDPDDWLANNAISRRVQILREHPKIALLRNNVRKFVEGEKRFDDYACPPGQQLIKKHDFFWEILERRTFIAPVSMFVRSQQFLKVNPTRTIYTTPSAGQNFQMLLPLARAYPVLDTAEPLGFYRIRKHSHSHFDRTPKLLINREKMVFDVLCNTLQKLDPRDFSLEARLNLHYRALILLPLYFRSRNLQEALRLIDCVEPKAYRRFLMRLLLRFYCSRVGRRCMSCFHKKLKRVFLGLLSDQRYAWTLRKL